MDASIQVAEIRASRGASWIGEAWTLFAAAPMAWIGLCAGWIALTFALFVIPFIGGVAASFLQPVFFASFAIAAYRQAAGERIVMADLFAGFKRNVRALVNLGAVLLMAQIVIVALMALLGLPMSPPASDQPFSIADYAEAMSGKEWILALGVALTILVKGSLWFAPQLIAFHGMGTAQAMRWSVYAAIANIGALTVYGLAVLGLFIAALLPMPWVVGLVVVLPLTVISSYVGYRDVFEGVKSQ
jgi:uncharacterized membrane protein